MLDLIIIVTLEPQHPTNSSRQISVTESAAVFLDSSPNDIDIQMHDYGTRHITAIISHSPSPVGQREELLPIVGWKNIKSHDHYEKHCSICILPSLDRTSDRA